MSKAYYNEIDPFAAQWLRNLISAGLIAPGEVDQRSIEDVTPSDLTGFTQCHFFAGVGVWSLALRQAGWPDDRPVWTGSCPCQPFSAAGKGDGFADERHLWPALHWLISHGRPSTFLGEQVASKDGLAWFDLVQADLEAENYTTGAVDLCAAGFGAPHLRQRLYFVADTTGNEGGQRHTPLLQWGRQNDFEQVRGGSIPDGVADPFHAGSQGRLRGGEDEERQNQHGHVGRDSAVDRFGGSRPTNGFWRDADWLFCRDGKWRPVEPGTSPLADGTPARVGRVRGYGNAIVAPVAAAFVEAYLGVNHDYNNR